jgi:hypothetical protein
MQTHSTRHARSPKPNSASKCKPTLFPEMPPRPCFLLHHYENSTRLPPDLAALACALSALRLRLFES